MRGPVRGGGIGRGVLPVPGLTAFGKLVVPDGLHAHVVGAGVRLLGLSAEHGLAVASLPLHHRDPFDRLLIAQARQEGMTLVTVDTRTCAYDVAVLDPLA